MWTDKEIIDYLKKGMHNFVDFLGETKLGYLTFMFIVGLIFMILMGETIKYFSGRDYSVIAYMCGFMIVPVISVFTDKKHKDKNWW